MAGISTSVRLPSRFRLNTTPEVVSGRGSMEEAGPWLAARRVRRPLIITDRGVAEAGLATRVANSLRKAELDPVVFAEVDANPTVEQAEEAARTFSKLSADAVVGVGGGSGMDAAKVAALLATNGGSVRDHVGVHHNLAPCPTLVCIPTTCGTGSEVTFSALILDTAARRKLAIISRAMSPGLSLLDADLLETLPAPIAAASAFDAICHAVEGLTNKAGTPYSDALHREALRFLVPSIEAGVAGDADARERLLVGAMLAGVAVNTSAANLAHAMSYPLTTEFDVPHGAACAMLLPHVLEFNDPWAPERHREVAVMLGADPTTSAAEAAAQLLASLPLPRNPCTHGARHADIPRLVPHALESRNIALNPRPVSTTDVAEIYSRLVEGC